MRFQTLFQTVFLISFALLSRLIPHPPNATALNAVSLAAGSQLPRRAAIAVPLAAMLLGDLIIGFYEWQVLAAVYVSFALVALFASIERIRNSLYAQFLLLVSSSIGFFFATNTAVWAFSPWYEKSLAGLLFCYTLALPFFKTMLYGDLVYGAALIGAPALVHFARNRAAWPSIPYVSVSK